MSVDTSTELIVAQSAGVETPAVALDRVSLAFDDNVILRDISFTLLPGHTKSQFHPV